MNQVWLTSGNLPEKAYVESKSTVPASLGAQFLRYSLLTGIIGVLSVSLVIFLRYRKFFIVAPVIITGFSEIIIMLGVAAIINWEIDLPAIAGIIAAVGTGVDNQIVITDETLASKGQAKKSASVAERIRRAFFIIFTSAATIIAIMLPLMTFVAGMLKGFALTTMLGVLIGVFITRPAYAKIIEEFLKGSE
jgi:preprotein translocase subunit SecD